MPVATDHAAVVEHRVRLMGTDVHLLALEPRRGALARIEARLRDLEARWSRFRPDSEVSVLNAADGAPVAVSEDTWRLLATARAAWQATAGRFDPTVLPALLAAGYDRTFAALPPPPSDDRPLSAAGVGPAPGLAGLQLDPDTRQARLPAGVLVDPGGIGKGLAADLASTEAVGSGDVAGLLLNVGGDLRAVGAYPESGWGIDLDDPAGTLVGLRDGALATSTVSRRRWRGRDGDLAHHVIDPRSGAPAHTPLRSVTVVAGQAWRAETLATALLLDPDAPDLETVPTLLVDHAGGAHLRHGMKDFTW